MPQLASWENCTGCGACFNKCPQKCVSFKEDKLGNIYPFIDETACVNCRQCEKVCPQITTDIHLQTPEKAFAAWNNDSTIRKESASGGVASAFYRYALKKGISCYGVTFDSEWNINYIKIQNDDELGKVRNSKYAFSNTQSVFCEIKKELNVGKSVLWIGLPCQTAGLKKYLGEDATKLVTVDLICHGVCSVEYLKQYISSIEKERQHHYTQCFFRDANFDTSKFAYTLYTHTSAEPDYIEFVKDGLYSMGYHKGITYRENCYHCKYASVKRTGNLTLADYWLIGEKIPFSYEKDNVSLVFANDARGEGYLRNVIEEGFMTAVERPISEAIEVQGQLQHPTSKSFEQKIFTKSYQNRGDFVSAISKATRFRRFCDKNHLNRVFNLAYKVSVKVNSISMNGNRNEKV